LQPETEIDYSHGIELVAFNVCDQKYCIEITQIREIRRWSPVTVLPHAPSEILGVMNLRGAVIPIFDLACYFGLGRTNANERNVVIICAVKNRSVGILVESVSEIISIDPNEIQETPNVKSAVTKSVIQGVLSVEGEMARLISLDPIVDPELSDAVF